MIYDHVGGDRDRATICTVTVEILGGRGDDWEKHARFPVTFLERLTEARDAAGDSDERARLTALSIVVGRTPDQLHEMRRRVQDVLAMRGEV